MLFINNKKELGGKMQTWGRQTIYVKYTEEEILAADVEKQKQMVVEIIESSRGIHQQNNFILCIGDIIGDFNASENQNTKRDHNQMAYNRRNAVSGFSVTLVHTEVREHRQDYCRNQQQQQPRMFKYNSEICHRNPLLKSILSTAATIQGTAAQPVPSQARIQVQCLLLLSSERNTDWSACQQPL